MTEVLPVDIKEYNWPERCFTLEYLGMVKTYPMRFLIDGSPLPVQGQLEDAARDLYLSWIGKNAGPASWKWPEVGETIVPNIKDCGHG